MLLSLNKKNDGSKNAAHADAARSGSADFIPYYCHYNPHTLLTKNGELMQVIKITANLSGLDYENGTSPDAIAREVIRKAIGQCIETDHIALWMHTIRKRRPIENSGAFKEEFAGKVHARWQQIHRWKFQYYNEIYISVLYAGQPSLLLDTPNLKFVVLPKTNRDFRNAYLDVAYEELDKTVNRMISDIRQHFDAHRLTVAERVSPASEMPGGETLFYSEPMEFLGTILNLRSESFLLPRRDISDALCTTVQTFGFNALETKSPAGKRRFAGLLTLKQYREMPADTVDYLLQAPMEFIVSQAFHFIPPGGALKQFKEQKEILDISRDYFCSAASGLEEMIASHRERSIDFGNQQTSIMVLSDEFRQLDGEVSRVQETLGELGLITIREDIKLEECFWGQMPGNFEFLRRRDTINTLRIGGFMRLNRYPNGTAKENHWGDAVTILPTLVKSPYFFNFHYQDNGHTVVFDFNSFNDQVLPIMLNFLLSEARKFSGRLFIFDRLRSASLLMQKLQGDYHNFPALMPPKDNPKEYDATRLNPFRLEGNARNKGFLAAWCTSLIPAELAVSEEHKSVLKQAIEHLYANDPSRRHLAGLVEIIAGMDAAFAKAFAKWHGEGAYAEIFGTGEENIKLEHMMHAFDMSPVVAYRECVIPIFSYLLHRIVTEADGRPTMIVLYEAWDLIENPFIAPRLESLMEVLQQNNAMIIFTTSKPQHVTGLYSFSAVRKNCATHLFIPDDVGRDYLPQELGLSENDAKTLLRMDRQSGDFLLKQGNETIALRADVRQLDDIHAVFANDIKNLMAALGKFSEEREEE